MQSSVPIFFCLLRRRAPIGRATLAERRRVFVSESLITNHYPLTKVDAISFADANVA